MKALFHNYIFQASPGWDNVIRFLISSTTLFLALNCMREDSDSHSAIKTRSSVHIWKLPW